MSLVFLNVRESQFPETTTSESFSTKEKKPTKRKTSSTSVWETKSKLTIKVFQRFGVLIVNSEYISHYYFNAEAGQIL